MIYLRASIKLMVFLVVTLFLYSVIMICLAGSFLGINYEKYRGYLLKFWGSCSCWILGLQVEAKGNVPEPPFLLVANHLSYLDIFVLFSQVRCLFVAKSDVKTWPFVGFIIRTCGILFIDRNRKRDITRVNDLISKNINQNQGIILFPEGTTSPGIDILPFKTSLLKHPASLNFPVSYATITYSTVKGEIPAYESICWWDDTPFLTHFLNFLKMKGGTAEITFGNEPIQRDDRKALALELREQMSKQFESVIEREAFLENHEPFKPLSI